MYSIRTFSWKSKPARMVHLDVFLRGVVKIHIKTGHNLGDAQVQHRVCQAENLESAKFSTSSERANLLGPKAPAASFGEADHVLVPIDSSVRRANSSLRIKRGGVRERGSVVVDEVRRLADWCLGELLATASSALRQLRIVSRLTE